MAGNWSVRAHAGRKVLAAFFLLCLLMAIGAMRSDLFPDAYANLVPPLEQEALPLALLAIVATILALVRRARWPRGHQLWAVVLIGQGLFVVPALLLFLSRDWVSSFTRVALISLVPVFAVVLEPHLGAASPQGESRQNKLSLFAALVSVVGAFCIFPVDLPASFQAGAAFAAVIGSAACLAATNCYAVRVAAESSRSTLAPMAAVAATSAAAVLLVASALTHGLVFELPPLASSLAWSALISLPGLVLLFWLLLRMTATRMTTRFVIAPLIAILLSAAIDRPKVSLLICAGMLLIAGGAGWLLFMPDDDLKADHSSLGLHRDL